MYHYQLGKGSRKSDGSIIVTYQHVIVVQVNVVTQAHIFYLLLGGNMTALQVCSILSPVELMTETVVMHRI